MHGAFSNFFILSGIESLRPEGHDMDRPLAVMDGLRACVRPATAAGVWIGAFLNLRIAPAAEFCAGVRPSWRQRSAQRGVGRDPASACNGPAGTGPVPRSRVTARDSSSGETKPPRCLQGRCRFRSSPRERPGVSAFAARLAPKHSNAAGWSRGRAEFERRRSWSAQADDAALQRPTVPEIDRRLPRWVHH